MWTKLGLIWWSIVTLANTVALVANSIVDSGYLLGGVTVATLIISSLMLVACWSDLEATND